MSQEVLAERLTEVDGFSVTHTTVRNYEMGPDGGTKKVPSEYVAIVCKTLGLRVEWLVFGEEPKQHVAPDVEAAAFREIAAIVDRARATASAAGEVDVAADGDNTDNGPHPAEGAKGA